jgi:hypothetical protein
MIIQFPNVVFRWHNAKRGICGIEDYITDFEKGNYGYNLTAGQCVYMLIYHRDKKSCYIYHASIAKVTKEGVLVSDWMERGWETDHAAEHNLLTEDGKAFFPWVYDGDNLEVEPCESFYENYKAKDLINGTARLNNDKYIGDRLIPDPKGSGLYYKHGGWRQSYSKYHKNLENIVKLGQQELDIYV